MFRKSEDGSKLRAPTSMLVLHKNGDVEINCGRCKKGVIVPLKMAEDGGFELRKSPSLRFVVPRELDRRKSRQ